MGPAPFASGRSKVRARSQPAGRVGKEKSGGMLLGGTEAATQQPPSPKPPHAGLNVTGLRDPIAASCWLWVAGTRALGPYGSRALTLPSLPSVRASRRRSHLPPPPPPRSRPLCPLRPPSKPRQLATGRERDRERGSAAGHHGIKEDSTLRPAAPEVTGAEGGERRKRRKTPGRAAFRRRRSRSAIRVGGGRVGFPDPEWLSEDPNPERGLSLFGTPPAADPRQSAAVSSRFSAEAPRGWAANPGLSRPSGPRGPSRAQHARSEADHPGLLQDGAAWRQVPSLRR